MKNTPHRNLKEINSNNNSKINEDNVDNILNKILEDKRSAYFGEINNKYLFIVILLVYVTGFGNVLAFPILVNEQGGIIFLIIYFFVSISVAMPIYLIEAGIGQFYSKTSVTVFNMTPILKGLGWSCLLFNILTLIPHCNLLSWIYMYMMYSTFTDMPWRYCKVEYTNIKCVVNHFNTTFMNKSISFETSGELFFGVYIQGLRNPKTGILYTFENALESINVMHLISFVIIWIIIFILSLIFIGLYSKVIYINFIVLVLFLIILLLRTACLPGSFLGMKEYFSPSIKQSISLGSITSALIHCVYSTGVGTAVIISIASLNNFTLDFYWASYMIIIGDYIFSFLSGIFQYSVLGYMAKENQFPSVMELLKTVPFKFNTFFDGTKTLTDSRFLCIFYSFILLNFGICTAAILVMCLVLSLIDYYPCIFKYSKNRKLLVNVVICLIMFVCCIFYSLRGSILYQNVFNMYLESFAAPLVVLSEIIVVHFLYGTRHFRNDMKMILGYYYNFIWVIDSNVILPMAMFLLICYSFIISSKIFASIWVKLISYLFVFICLIPIFVLSYLEIVKYSKEFRNNQLLINLLRPPIIIGPYYKKNWTINKYYQRKLRDLQYDDRFLQTVCEKENVQEIIRELNQKTLEKHNERRATKTKVESLTQPFNFSI